MRSRISIRGYIRPSVGRSVGRSVRRSVGRSVGRSVCPALLFFAKGLIELRVCDLWRSALFFNKFRYTANLAAHLTVTLRGRDYDSLEDLRREGIPVYIADSLFHRRMIQKTFPIIYQDIVAHSWFWRHRDEILGLLERGNAVYGFVFELQRIISHNCSLGVEIFHYVGTEHSGFAMTKDHPMLGSISRQMIRYLAEGRIEDIIDKSME